MIKKFYLNNDTINLELNKMIIIGEGKEGVVYKYNNNECIKIFNGNRNNGQLLKINEEKFKLFTELKTDRIILPSNLLYDINNQIVGYLMKYINDRFDIDYIRNKNISFITSELKDLKKDIEILNDNDILINDLKPSHLLYNNGFYLIDSSLYSNYQYDKVLNYNAIERNIFLVNGFLTSILLRQGKDSEDFNLDFKDMPDSYFKSNKINITYLAEILEIEADKYKINSLNELRLIYKKGLNSLKNK